MSERECINKRILRWELGMVMGHRPEPDTADYADCFRYLIIPQSTETGQLCLLVDLNVSMAWGDQALSAFKYSDGWHACQ